jgi:DNA-binding transcriptional regulator GbsR (MarR family)
MESSSEISALAGLAEFERECIDLFVHAAQALNIPRSIGEIYGALYASPDPLSMDQITERLGISKGSASQGLRWLRAIGAVRTTYIAGDRRDHFLAQTALRELAEGFLREQVQPHLRRGDDYLSRLDQAASAVAGGTERKFARDRLQKVRRWHRFAARILPLFLRIAARV